MKPHQKIEYKKIEIKQAPKYRKQLSEFYNHYFPEESNRLIINKSSVFFVALENDKVIGCCRLLSDFSRNAILFDLIVRKAKRNQGIGKKITRMVIEYCQKQSIKKVYLITDSRQNWLKNFYQKLGFSVVLNQVLMKIEN